MAGGQGTRLWPLSRRHTPKQFLSLLGEEAMLSQCYGRLRALLQPSDIYVSCVPEFAPLVRRLLPELPADHLIAEPGRRDSGPAMAFVAKILSLHGHGQEPLAFIPTDHAIEHESRFLDTLRAGLELAAETNGFVDIGITPTAPLTTLGYTKIGEEIEKRHGVSVHRFLGHVEKPKAEVAEQLLASGEYLWHGSYYMASPEVLLAAYKQHAPEIFDVVDGYMPDEDDWTRRFLSLKPVSIDFAVTEHLPADAMRVLKGEFGWSDVGQFAQLKEWQERTGVAANRAKHVSIGSTGCLVISRPDKMVATIGLQDVAIIDTTDALLVCPLDRAAEVKRLVELLEEEGHQSIL